MRHYAVDSAPRRESQGYGQEPSTALASLELTPRWHLASRLHSIDRPEAVLHGEVRQEETEHCCQGDASPSANSQRGHCCCHGD
jgi:hypothetical protein